MKTQTLLSLDIRAIRTPQVLKQWIDAVIESGGGVYVELRKVNYYNDENDLVLGFYLVDRLEELENSDPDFYFSYNSLKQEFWQFVGAVASSQAVLDDKSLIYFQ